MKNIILIGFMGSGKSTIATLLAEKLGWSMTEMDQLILEQSKYPSITQIFEIEGEIAFREKEITVAKELMSRENTIISTGGGVVMNKIIIDYLKKKGTIVYLQTELTEIQKRLRDDTTRPLFTNLKIAKELFTLRAPLYQAYADIIINEKGKTVSQIVETIIDKIKE